MHTLKQHVNIVQLVLNLQAKNEFLCDAHECHGYYTGKEQETAVDMDGHERCFPGCRWNWYQVHANSENKLPIEGEKKNIHLSDIALNETVVHYDLAFQKTPEKFQCVQDDIHEPAQSSKRL